MHLQSEFKILDVIGWAITEHTVYSFLTIYVSIINHSNPLVASTCYCLAERILLVWKIQISFPPSIISASVLYFVENFLNFDSDENNHLCHCHNCSQSWDKRMEYYTGYKSVELLDCVYSIRKILQDETVYRAMYFLRRQWKQGYFQFENKKEKIKLPKEINITQHLAFLSAKDHDYYCYLLPIFYKRQDILF